MMSQRVTYSALFLKEVRITFQTYDCCEESFVVKQGALFYEKTRNIFILTNIKLLLYVLWKQIVIQFTPNGLVNEIKTEGYRVGYIGFIPIPNNTNNPIFMIFIVCATIVSAVEGLNGLKNSI